MMNGQADRTGGVAPLTTKQRALVEANLGLVGLHIRRNVRNTAACCCDRDYEDLFQEGCCGLMQAARSFDPGRGIRFPAYALPRIHTAVSTALYENASLIRVPRQRHRRRAQEAREKDGVRRGPKVFPLEDDPMDRRNRRAEPVRGQRTVGERLRDKYEAAVEVAACGRGWRKARRADRAELVSRLVEYRLRVPDPEDRTAIREIARATGSSFSRVLQCERRLKEGVRRALVGDLEFQRLLKLSREAKEGQDHIIDAQTAEELRQLAGEGFWRRLSTLGQQTQTRLFTRLLHEGQGGLGASVQALFALLPQGKADEMSRLVSNGA